MIVKKFWIKNILSLGVVLLLSIGAGQAQSSVAMDSVQLTNCTELIPEISMIPVSYDSPDHPNPVNYGSHYPDVYAYYTYKDHAFNKLYMIGRYIHAIDFNNVVNGEYAYTNYTDLFYTKVQKLERAVSDYTNKIYFATHRDGIYVINRQTGSSEKINPLEGINDVSYKYVNAHDVMVDNTNNILYASIFYVPPGGNGYNNPFYGILVWDLVTDTKSWINTSSSPVSIPQVRNASDSEYWSGGKVTLDEMENIIYFSSGYGLWYWDRDDNSTGIYNTSGGIPVSFGNPQIPSDLTTHIYIDHTDNQFYIGTHKGLFVWDRNNNTSKVYNSENSSLFHNVINHIDKYDEGSLVFAACELGGLFEINTATGSDRLYLKGIESEAPTNYITDVISVSSVNFDEVDKKLYVSSWRNDGGVWIRDYSNMVEPTNTIQVTSSTTICTGTSLQLSVYDNNPVDVSWGEIVNGVSEEIGVGPRGKHALLLVWER